MTHDYGWMVFCSFPWKSLETISFKHPVWQKKKTIDKWWDATICMICLHLVSDWTPWSMASTTIQSTSVDVPQNSLIFSAIFLCGLNMLKANVMKHPTIGEVIYIIPSLMTMDCWYGYRLLIGCCFCFLSLSLSVSLCVPSLVKVISFHINDPLLKYVASWN